MREGNATTGDITQLSTGYLALASGTTAQRPASPINGMVRYNTNNALIEAYMGGAWQNVATLNAELTGLSGLSVSGLVTRTASGTYTGRTITAGSGISITNGDGITGNPTISASTDLLAVESLATTGVAVRTGTSTWATRTITAPAAGITITNGDGVAGNPTLALANDLAALEGLAASGFAARTATDTWAIRSLTAPAAGLTITNPAGTAGNPTFALANDLAGVEGLATNGIAARTATDTWTTRTITGTTNQISVTNGDGVSGNPTLAIASDVILPGTGAVTVVDGTTAQRPASPTNAMLRFNTDTNFYEVYQNSAWRNLVTSIASQAVTTITGDDGATSEPMMFIYDSARGTWLSVESQVLHFNNNSVNANDFMIIDSALNSNVGYPMPYDGVIVRAAVNIQSTNGNTKNFSIYVNATENTGVLTNSSTPSNNNVAVASNVNISFTRGDYIRARARGSGGNLSSVVMTIWVKWRF